MLMLMLKLILYVYCTTKLTTLNVCKMCKVTVNNNVNVIEM